MALKNRDPESIREALAAWLPRVLHTGGPIEISDLHIPSANGMSSETVLFDCSWTQDGRRGSRGLVARIPPREAALFPDHDLGRDLRVMSALAAHSPAPVPAVVAHETTGTVLGAPFALVDRVHGRVPSDDPPFVTGGWVHELTPPRRAALFDNALRAISEVQQADPVALGLTDLLRPELGDSVIDQELAYWRQFYHWAAGERRSPTIEKAFDILTGTRPDDRDPPVVVWGDARLGNLMFDDDQNVTGVFDWEMATLGRREVDLGYFLFFDRFYSTGMGLPRLDGFPGRQATIARFEELTGHSVTDLDWFEAWAALRGSILLLRVGAVMIEHGQLPPDAAMPVNNPATQVLAALLNLPAPDGEACWIVGHR
jgi:aminoglycoside phosphotransferase (APT) family kinase protein